MPGWYASSKSQYIHGNAIANKYLEGKMKRGLKNNPMKSCETVLMEPVSLGKTDPLLRADPATDPS